MNTTLLLYIISGHTPESKRKMEENEKTEEQTRKPDENPDFIQEFIERQKLQNRVLQEIIDKIKQTENPDKTTEN